MDFETPLTYISSARTVQLFQHMLRIRAFHRHFDPRNCFKTIPIHYNLFVSDVPTYRAWLDFPTFFINYYYEFKATYGKFN